MKKLLMSSILAIGLTGCVVSGHPSTDTHHSHVDTSSTRYDEYDPNYDYHDATQPRNHRRLYQEFNKHEHDGYYDDKDDYVGSYYGYPY